MSMWTSFHITVESGNPLMYYVSAIFLLPVFEKSVTKYEDGSLLAETDEVPIGAAAASSFRHSMAI